MKRDPWEAAGLVLEAAANAGSRIVVVAALRTQLAFVVEQVMQQAQDMTMRPEYIQSQMRLVWPNGSRATLIAWDGGQGRQNLLGLGRVAHAADPRAAIEREIHDGPMVFYADCAEPMNRTVGCHRGADKKTEAERMAAIFEKWGPVLERLAEGPGASREPARIFGETQSIIYQIRRYVKVDNARMVVYATRSQVEKLLFALQGDGVKYYMVSKRLMWPNGAVVDFEIVSPEPEEVADMIEVTKENIDEVFRYHAPKPDQIPRFNAITEAAKVFAQVVLDNSPRTPARTRALNAIIDARMLANQAIALEDTP